MAKIPASEFLKNPERAVESPAVVLAGPEYLFRREARTAVFAALRRRHPEAVLRRLDKAASFAEIAGEARSVSMWSPKQVLCVGMDKKLAQAELEPLKQYLEMPDPPSLLVLEWEAPDERLKFSQLMAAKACWVSCAPLPGKALRGWLKDRARAMGRSLPDPVLDVLLDVVGENLSLLVQEMEKAALYAPQAKAFTEAVFREVATPFRNFAWFDLTDAVGARDTGAALRILQSLLMAGESPVGVIAGVASHARKLLQVRLLMDKRLPPASICQQLKLHPYYGEKLMRQARLFTSAALQDALEICYRSDLALKSGGMASDRIGAERLVVALAKGLPPNLAA